MNVKINLSKIDCGWCYESGTAQFKIIDGDWTDYVCHNHRAEWFPNTVVSLVKEYGISFRQETGMDRADYDATIMLPYYLKTIYPSVFAVDVNRGLKRNDLHSLSTLLHYERHYDNSTGKLV